MATRKHPLRKTVKKSEPPSENPPDDGRSSLREHAIEQARSLGVRDTRAELQLMMMDSVIAEPLLSKVQISEERSPNVGQRRFDVIISLNDLFDEGLASAAYVVQQLLTDWSVGFALIGHNLAACLSTQQIFELAEQTRDLTEKLGAGGSPVFRIWEDSDIHLALTKSIATIKADGAHRAFAAFGKGIVWAVLDSGIQGDHPHFRSQASLFQPVENLVLRRPLQHLDFTPAGDSPLVDRLGHGTHVAGIIGGQWQASEPSGSPVAGREVRDEKTREPRRYRDYLQTISGIAPHCTLLSLKVIADVSDPVLLQTAGQGKISWVLRALDRIQQWNEHGRFIRIHGVNISLAYDFDPRWFGCGLSPLCQEVDRLVRSGVVVVVAAGNGGYGSFLTAAGSVQSLYSDLSIMDPGNAELAITVGATHRETPHRYGALYFSSRGPTADGRKKPDLLAPGGRIISCASGVEAAKYGASPDGNNTPLLYCEQSGTSMAAPHVSGAIAAFLSARPDFVGYPEKVKAVFLSTAVNLGRDHVFQGAGLVDLMKALQAV